MTCSNAQSGHPESQPWASAAANASINAAPSSADRPLPVIATCATNGMAASPHPGHPSTGRPADVLRDHNNHPSTTQAKRLIAALPAPRPAASQNPKSQAPWHLRDADLKSALVQQVGRRRPVRASRVWHRAAEERGSQTGVWPNSRQPGSTCGQRWSIGPERGPLPAPRRSNRCGGCDEARPSLDVGRERGVWHDEHNRSGAFLGRFDERLVCAAGLSAPRVDSGTSTTWSRHALSPLFFAA